MKNLLAQLKVGKDIVNPPAGSQTDLGDLGALVSRLLQYLLPLSGLILFAMIIISGFKLLTSAGNPKGIEEAKQRLQWSIVGFLVVFAAFWLMRILEFLLGIKVL